MKKSGSFGGKMAAPFGKGLVKGAAKKPGGQGTGHLSKGAVKSFGKSPSKGNY